MPARCLRRDSLAAAAAVRQLWSVFQQPRLHAAFELYNAAMQGAAFGNLAGSAPARDEPMLAALTDLVRRSVAAD